MSKIMGMLPLPGVTREMKDQMASAATDKRVKHLEAIINSMTPAERANHNLLDGKRKRRISAGCGRPVSEINQLLKQFVETKKMMGQMNDPRFMARMQRMAKTGSAPKFPF
jgi:signal recognition particle subunit SRP54